jgi:hypothetical protein
MRWVVLECHTCGGLFYRLRSQHTRSRRDPKYTTKLSFCSKKCYGQFFGKTYGWNIQRQHRPQVVVEI